MIQGAYKRFKDFLSIEYPLYSNSLKPKQLNKDMIKAFVVYLESKSKGEGARGYYQRFKKVVANAEEKGHITKNPCKGIICQIDENILRKDILSVEEMGKLIKTTYTGQNDNIRRAFIFSLYTGIRYCDVLEMKYSNVDYSNKILSFEQAKTKKKSANSGVVIPLNDGLLSLIGEKPAKDSVIFELPSHTMCLKALRHWTARASIDKHITWHCARHSFAVQILNNGANIKTVASLLGHSGLKHTEKYTRAVDDLKEKAINSLPELKL
jgi:integrase/recombinase XerD